MAKDEKDKCGGDKSENREKILECALKLFYSYGYDAVGVQEIADTAGITKPTLYYYFKSKYGLLENLLNEKCSNLIRELNKACQFNGDLPYTLEAVCRTYLEMAEKEKEFYYFMVGLFYSARGNEAYRAVKPYMTEQFRLICGVFTQAENSLGNMNGRQEQFAIGFIGVINQYILVYYERSRKGSKMAAKEAVYSLVHQFMHGIYS